MASCVVRSTDMKRCFQQLQNNQLLDLGLSAQKYYKIFFSLLGANSFANSLVKNPIE